MREDDTSETFSADLPPSWPRNPELWPEHAVGVLCAMDTVDSMHDNPIRYSMYGAFDFSDAQASNSDLANCQARNCIPLIKQQMYVSYWQERGQVDCQNIALGKSHPFYAFGE